MRAINRSDMLNENTSENAKFLIDLNFRYVYIIKKDPSRDKI